MIHLPTDDAVAALNRPIVSGQRYAQLARPQNVLYPGLLAVLACVTSGVGIGRGLVCYATLLCLYGLASGLNNYIDIPVDIANSRNDNPLTQVPIRRRQLAGFFVAHAAVLLLLQFWLAQPATAIICICYLTLLAVYSLPPLSLQRRGLLATLILAICYGSLALLLGGLQTSSNSRIGLPMIWLLELAALQIVLLAPLLLAKDYKDMTGDIAYGKQTPLVRYDRPGVIKLAIFGTGIACAATALYVLHLNHIVQASYPIRYIGIILGLYAALVYIIHCRQGWRNPWINRWAQLTVLLLSWLLLSNIS